MTADLDPSAIVPASIQSFSEVGIKKAFPKAAKQYIRSVEGSYLHNSFHTQHLHYLYQFCGCFYNFDNSAISNVIYYLF